MYERAVYKDTSKIAIEHIPDPIGTIKYDGANFFLRIDQDGSPRFFSRRQSVKGHFPERTNILPHLTDVKLPQFAGKVYNVELIHTGHSKENVESHPRVSGILTSLPEKAINTQKSIGPVRAVLFDVISPKMNSYKDKLDHLNEVQKAFSKPDLIYTAPVKIGLDSINKLLADTASQGREGIVVTSLTTPESKNIRLKVKHVDTYNLKVIGITQEFDILGNPKESAGALDLEDATGRYVGRVGTGFSREIREDIFKNPNKWINKLIQVKAMPSTSSKLRSAVYNGDADGNLDIYK